MFSVRVVSVCCLLMTHSLSGDDFADLLGSAVEVFIVVNVQLFFFARNHLLGHVRVCALEAQNHRLREGVFLVSLDDRCS